MARAQAGLQGAVIRSDLDVASDDPVLVRHLERSGLDGYREFVDRHPRATVFHGLEWKRAVERAFGHRTWFLTAFRGDTIVGVLPVYQINSVLAGRLLVSVPYATYGGLLATDRGSCAALLMESRALMDELGARSLELRSITAADPNQAVQGRHVTFRKPLPLDPAQVASTMPRKARAAARRAEQRHGLTVEFGAGHLSTVWSLYARSMRRLGSPNYPFRFFEELAAALGDRLVVQLVCRDGRPVAGLATFLFRDTVMPYFAGADERHGVYGLNQYMYLQSMQWGVEHGYRRYDFGRSRTDNAGACDFKRHCGFEPEPLEYQTYVAPGRTAPSLTPSARRWTMARRAWKRLPLRVTRPLGGWLSRSIPG